MGSEERRRASADGTAIETTRLNLRPLWMCDLPLLASVINNPRISRNLARVPWPYKLDDARNFYDYTRNLPFGSAVFAITLRPGSNRVVGLIGYEGAPHPELGYWLAEEYWGKGLIREGARAVVEHAFSNSDVDRLISRCMLGNEQSRCILVTLGFRPTEICPVYSIARDYVVTSQAFELTSREWTKQRACMTR
jgi:RimJ/RimL family protein N-acetyltransferase